MFCGGWADIIGTLHLRPFILWYLRSLWICFLRLRPSHRVFLQVHRGGRAVWRGVRGDGRCQVRHSRPRVDTYPAVFGMLSIF